MKILIFQKKKTITIKSPLNMCNNFTSYLNNAGIENSIACIKSPIWNSNIFLIYIRCSTKKHYFAPHKFTSIHQKVFFRKASFHRFPPPKSILPLHIYSIHSQKKYPIGWRKHSMNSWKGFQLVEEQVPLCLNALSYSCASFSSSR